MIQIAALAENGRSWRPGKSLNGATSFKTYENCSMFVLIFVNSWSIGTGFKFWMMEAAFAPIGRAEICSFIVPSFCLKPLTGRLPLSRLSGVSLRLLGSDSPGSRQRGLLASVCWRFGVSSRAHRRSERDGSIARTLLYRRTG